MAMDDLTAMRRAIDEAASVRTRTAPNPWVGAVVVAADGALAGAGATQPPGGPHAEVVALGAAGAAAAGSTLFVTLEPCSHHGRTPPCVEAVVAAGVSRVVVGVEDPDPRVAGRGVAALRGAGIEVEVGAAADLVTEQLTPYLHHRRTGRPYVVGKLATTIDGAIAAPDGSSQWITGAAARADAHRLRAESGAIVVGAGTVRTDDPSLTVRHVDGPDPLRVVLGAAPPDARVHPCLEWSGDLPALLDELGSRGVLQVMVEGGSTVMRSFHEQGLVDRYVLYVAPAMFTGRDALPMIAGPSSPTMAELWRGRFVDVRPLGDDLRVDLVPHDTTGPCRSRLDSPKET
jgi:diaminohydroxyphosphoribosylaminopyrimidine deaminase / 5-amino-6-(5-phosphoribosylamino)uracil reductase